MNRTTDEENQEIIDYRSTFLTDHGKRVLDRMKRKAKFHTGHKPKKLDGDISTNELLWQAAQRSVIIDIENTLKKEPK
jgi:hypothetical protein